MSWINTQIVGSGPSPRGYHGSAVISEDRLILFGGMTTTKILNTKEKPLSDSPSKESTRKLLKTTSSSSYLSESTPEVDEPVYLNDLWLFDNTKRAEEKWCMLEAKGDIPSRRAQHSMLGISEDRVVLFGGFDGTRFYNDLYVLDFKTLFWRRINAGGKDTPKARAGHIVAAFTGSLGTSMVIFGGKNETNYFNDLFILDLKDWKWILALTSGDAPSPRAFASGSSIGTQLYIFGGEFYDKTSNKWEPYNDLFYINTTNMRWVKPELTSGSVAPTPRYSHSATLFNNGKTLLVFGGSSNRSGNLCDPSVFLFDAEHSKWLKCTVKSATSGDEPPARSMHTAQLLFGSKIVIFGGVKTECYANDDGYVMQNIYTNTVFIFYHLELIEPKKEVRKRQSKAGKIVSDAFDSIFKKDHHHGDKDKKKKRHSSKKEELVKEISRPYNAQRVRHVNFELEWTGNPSEIFVLEEQLGKGSFGSVFRAKERETGYVMAIKEIELKQSTSELKNEIDILKKFNHNNVVKYFGSLVHGQKIWILMEYCALGSIRDLIETGDSPLKEDEIAFVTQHTLAGLTVLHTKKIIHRDVKAANILLTEEGQVKIADFGVSDTLGKANQSIGTPLWMAPEVIQKKDYDSRCDIWSLGITIIEMADGFPPHHKMPPMRAMMMVPLKEPPTVTEPSKWSNHFNDFVAKCLVKDPKARPQAMDLLTHPFVTGNKTPQVLQEKIKKCMGIRAAKRQQTAKQEMTGTGTFGSTIGSTSGYGTGTGTGTGTGIHLSHSRNNSMTGPIIILKDAITEPKEEKRNSLIGSGSIKRSSVIQKEEESSDIWSTTKTNNDMADTVDKFSTSVVNEDANNNYGTSVMHEEVEQPPPVRKDSKKTRKEKAAEKQAEKQVEKPVEKPAPEDDIFATSVVKDDEPADDIYATSVQHDDAEEENADIYATSVQHDEPAKKEEEEETDIYATSVQHEEPPAPKVTIKRKDSKKELPGEDIFATSVTHEDLPPKPVRKDSGKREISPRLRDEISAGALSGSAPSASLNAADIKQIMEATTKAIKESEQRMLQALHDLRGEITNQMENANQITVYVENKKDRMAETTEALRTFVRDHLHEADQATLLNMISVLKKKKR